MKMQRAKLVVPLMTLAGFAFIGATIVMLVAPAFREVGSLASQIIDAQTELEAQYANRRHLLESIEEIRRVKDTVSKLSSQFVPEKQELSFITAAEEIAARRGVEERLRLSANPAAGTLEELRRSFEISLTGEFRAVMEAMLDLERLPQLIVIDAVQVNASQNSDGANGPVTAVLRGAIAFPPAGL